MLMISTKDCQKWHDCLREQIVVLSPIFNFDDVTEPWCVYIILVGNGMSVCIVVESLFWLKCRLLKSFKGVHIIFCKPPLARLVESLSRLESVNKSSLSNEIWFEFSGWFPLWHRKLSVLLKTFPQVRQWKESDTCVIRFYRCKFDIEMLSTIFTQKLTSRHVLSVKQCHNL